MQSIISGEKVTWIDLENPTEEELIDIANEYNIHPLVANDLQRQIFRPKIDTYDSFLYLVLHFPFYKGADAQGHETDFIIGQNFLVTVRYQKIPTLAAFMTSCKEDKSINKQYLSGSSGKLLYHLLSQLFVSSIKSLEVIDQSITKVENSIFKTHRRDMIERILELRRDILDLRRIVQPQEPILVALSEQGKKFFGKDIAPYLNNITGDYLRVWHMLENHKEMIEALQDSNESLISMRTAEITKNLTIIAFVTLPLSLLANIFSMNTHNIPIIGAQYDFWIIIAIMLLAVIGLFVYFKSKRWI